MKKATYFSWRTAPRSIQVLLDWLPYFNKFQGEAWNEKIDNNYVLRRKLRWIFENDKEYPDNEVINFDMEQFSKGMQIGTKDKESLVRQQFTTGEQFGFLGTKGKKNYLFVTEAGKRVVEKRFSPEDFLIQLIKMYVIPNKEEEGVFPFEEFINLLKIYTSLSKYELAYMFAITTPSLRKSAEKAIEQFRIIYNDKTIINNKRDENKISLIHKEIWEKNFGGNTYLKSWEDYSDAFMRAMMYTDMFYTSGRGAYTKIRVKKHYIDKFTLLTSPNFSFTKPPYKIEYINNKETKVIEIASRDDLNWFGAVGNIDLPWDNFIERKELVYNTLQNAKSAYSTFINEELTEYEVKEFENKINETKSITELKDIEKRLSDKIKIRNQKEYINKISQTREAKDEVLNRFEIILKDKDMNALWLEVNTWKSLVCIKGDKEVIPNFTMEEDLTPRAFAQGHGDTPDMELYTDKYSIVPEVSLMSGKVQWEHEGSSVIDHVFKIQNQSNKPTIGLFISQSINNRTMWQFFMLCKNSWIGKPVPVIPLTIAQYVSILNYIYDNELDIDTFYNILNECYLNTKVIEDYNIWKENIQKIIDRSIITNKTLKTLI